MKGPTDAVLRYTVSFSLFMTFVLVVLFAWLAFRKVRVNRRKREVRQLLEVYQSDESRLEEAMRMGAGGSAKFDAARDALLHRISVDSSAEEKGHVSAWAELYWMDDFRARLTRGKWSARINTLLLVEGLHMTGMKSDLLLLVKMNRLTDMERFLVLRTLASFQAEEVLDELARHSDRLSEHQFLQILLPLRLTTIEKSFDRFQAYPLRLRCALIDVLRLQNARTEAVLAILEALLDNRDGEIRIRALKALSNFGYMSQDGVVRILRKMDQEPAVSWQERLMRAKLMGGVREDFFLNYLSALMGDESYPVRHEAAESISRYKAGMVKLARIAVAHPDRYAREMAGETLERKRYEREMG